MMAQSFCVLVSFGAICFVSLLYIRCDEFLEFASLELEREAASVTAEAGVKRRTST